MSHSLSLEEMVAVAKLPTTTMLTTKITGDGRVIVNLRTTKGRNVGNASAILLPGGCQLVIDAFDPDGSIRAAADAARKKCGISKPVDISLAKP